MKKTFPTYLRNSRTGKQGVSIVSQVIHDEFGWIFRNVPQEHDFGIDAHIDVVTAEGNVTGQSFAVQIKTGQSFLKRKGTVYRFKGDIKHLSYYMNSPTKIIIILCDAATKNCYWQVFDFSNIKINKSSWFLDIPIKNNLKKSKDSIENLLPVAVDMAEIITENSLYENIFSKGGKILFSIPRDDVESMNIDGVLAFFRRLKSTKSLARHAQGKVEISIDGYDEDARELFELMEVRSYISILSRRIHGLLFFASTSNPGHVLRLFYFCQATYAFPEGRLEKGKSKPIEIQPQLLNGFLMSHFPDLNEMTEWLGMSEDENKEITYNIFKCFNISQEAAEI